jgi:hypothetical protein
MSIFLVMAISWVRQQNVNQTRPCKQGPLNGQYGDAEWLAAAP